MYIRDREGTPKNLCNKDFAELLFKLSGAICLKTLVLLGSALGLFRKFFGAVRAIFGFGVLFLALVNREQKKAHKENPHKEFRESQGGGPGGRFRGPNSLCWCHISHQNTENKEFQKGGVSGFRGGGLRSNFGGHFFMSMRLFGT